MDEKISEKILTLLDQHRIMTVATLRPDGWPQATTVGYVNEGLTLYFLCGLDSQKAKNLAIDNRISLTIDHDTADLMAITGLSMAARAQAVADRAEAEKVLRMLPLKYPDAPPLR
jgi:nitroimidazol reductase NimA-like FMN-containing flavoprotein (pyridoxamine 5'-phosphate oxidase superfamily)